MADKESLAAKFRAAAQRAEEEARRKEEVVERTAKARDQLFVELAEFATLVGLITCETTETGLKLARGEKSIRFDRGEGTDTIVRLSDRELTARYAAEAWWLGDGPTAKPLWDDGLVWMLVNWLDMPNPNAPEPAASSAPPEVVTTVSKPPPPKPSAQGTSMDAPVQSRKMTSTVPGSRLQELKNPWD